MALLNVVPHCVPGFAHCFFKIVLWGKRILCPYSHTRTERPKSDGENTWGARGVDPHLCQSAAWASTSCDLRGASVPPVPCAGHRKAERHQRNGGNLEQDILSPLKADLSFFTALLRSSLKPIPRQFGHWISLGLNACSNLCLKSKPENHTKMSSWKMCNRAGICTQASLLWLVFLPLYFFTLSSLFHHYLRLYSHEKKGGAEEDGGRNLGQKRRKKNSTFIVSR